MLYKAVVFILALILTSVSQAKVTVNIALTSIQPPLVIDNEKEHGLIFDVVDALNNQQQTFEFTTKLYPAKRLLAKFESYDVHMVAFNNINWGWLERGGKPSVNLTDGRDLFFRLKNPEFKADDGDNIGAVDGFHYAFANFDAVKLSKLPNVTLAHDEDGVLKLVEYYRVHRGISSETYLNWIAKSRPEMFAKLTVDYANPDHEYNRQFVVFEYSPVTVDELNRLLVLLYKDGTLQRIYEKYGLRFPTPETVINTSD